MVESKNARVCIFFPPGKAKQRRPPEEEKKGERGRGRGQGSLAQRLAQKRRNRGKGRGGGPKKIRDSFALGGAQAVLGLSPSSINQIVSFGFFFCLLGSDFFHLFFVSFSFLELLSW